MVQTKGTWEDGNVAALSTAVRWAPVRFDRQSLLNHYAVTRPWSQLPTCPPRTAFDEEYIVSYEATMRSSLLEALRTQPTLVRPRKVEVRTEVLECVFGDFTSTADHAFLAFCPDWGIRLIERQATSGLAYLLNRGEGIVRRQRIRAFLEALRIRKLPEEQKFEQAEVYSEVDRIDLEVRFPATDGGNRVVLVEAKLGHKLTKGQLSTYRKARKDHRLDCRIVGLNPEAGEGRHHTQVQTWPIVLWRDLWLCFEKERPKEDDGQLATFMAWLWLRIGGLNPGNSKSRQV